MKGPAGGTRDACATAAEVMAAIESLSAEENRRLKSFARYRLRGLGRAAMNQTFVSLLNAAVASTLEGTKNEGKGRKWAKSRVLFVDHMLGAMRSISGHWKRAYERRGTEAERLDCEVATEDDLGEVIRPTERAVDPRTDPFRSCAANEVLEALDKQFAADEDALLVIEARKEGMTVSEMVAELGLTEKQVKAATQRIRYFGERFL
jgi:hypothetical protein